MSVKEEVTRSQGIQDVDECSGDAVVYPVGGSLEKNVRENWRAPCALELQELQAQESREEHHGVLDHVSLLKKNLSDSAAKFSAWERGLYVLLARRRQWVYVQGHELNDKVFTSNYDKYLGEVDRRLKQWDER